MYRDLPFPGPPENAAIVDMVDNFIRLDFTYMPQGFSDVKGANYSNISVIGRSEPMLGYAGSGARMLSVQLIFAAHGRNGSSIYDCAMKEVIIPTRIARSWLYPDYSKGRLRGLNAPGTPHPVLFVIGEWFSVRCVVKNVQVNYKAPWGYNDVLISSITTPKTGFFGWVEGVLSRLPQGVTSILTQSSAQAYPDNVTVESRSSMVPLIAEVNISLQEASENTEYSPWDWNQVLNNSDTPPELENK
jgi:hypothetical protein